MTERLKVVSMLDRGGVLERLLREPECVTPAFDPVADLRRGVAAGYEVVLGFEHESPRSPRAWARDVHLQRAGAIEALLLRAALDTRPQLPADCFLAISVSAGGVLSDEMQRTFAECGPLERVVIVVCDESDVTEPHQLHRALEGARDAGATIAIDETASGYSSLKQVLRLRPEFVRVGADFVADIDRDHAKAAVVETFVGLASRIDARVVATGVPGRAELGVLRRMGVPLAQGPLFGEALPEMGELGGAVAQAIEDAEEAPEADANVSPLVEERPSLSYGASLETVADAFLDDVRHDVIVLVDERDRPLAMAERAALLRGEPYERPVTRISASSPLKAVARRAAARPLIERFHPLVVCDRRGVYQGIVRVEQLLDALAAD